jgi:hypothetical protein
MQLFVCYPCFLPWINNIENILRWQQRKIWQKKTGAKAPVKPQELSGGVEQE